MKKIYSISSVISLICLLVLIALQYKIISNQEETIKTYQRTVATWEKVNKINTETIESYEKATKKYIKILSGWKTNDGE